MHSLKIPLTTIDHTKGKMGASVELIGYHDFESPECREAQNLIIRAINEMPRDLIYVFRHFPLTQKNPHSYQAAKAAEAAALQGRFWEMHDLLFENQNRLDNESLIDYAESAGCDGDMYYEILEYPQLADHIDYDIRGGSRSGVNSVPAFFINGIRFQQDLVYENLITLLKKARDEMLAAG